MVVYGLEVPDGMSSFELEVFCFFYADEQLGETDRREIEQGMGLEREGLPHLLTRLEHFWNIVEIIWGWRDVIDEGV